MSQRVTSRTGVAVVSGAPESCPKKREFPEQLAVLIGLTALVLALAAWAHAVDGQDQGRASSSSVRVEAVARH
jgi:hypothetical protein